jgi:hypothetical protein
MRNKIIGILPLILSIILFAFDSPSSDNHNYLVNIKYIFSTKQLCLKSHDWGEVVNELKNGVFITQKGSVIKIVEKLTWLSNYDSDTTNMLGVPICDYLERDFD